VIDDGLPGDMLLDLRAAGEHRLRAPLEDGLRAAIQNGRLVAGTRLPPSRILAADLGLSRGVVVEAYRNLIAGGFLEARRGAWTKVRALPASTQAPPPIADAAAFFARPRRASLLRAEIRLLGGVPDPALFPRARWARHYQAALADLPGPQLTYPDMLGAEPLRAALAAYLGRVRGIVAAPEGILVSAGVTQGLTLVCRALARAGARRIAVEDPCFGLHRMAIAATGLEPVPVRVDGNGIDPTALPDVDAVLVAPAHSYPSGATLSEPRRLRLVAWARRRDALIVEDDYDAELRYDRDAIGALQPLAPERVVYLGSASKILSPALRIGWIVAPERLLGELARDKFLGDMGSSLLEQLAYARFVDGGDLVRHLRRVRPVYRRRRDATISAVVELLPRARWRGEAAGLHLHVELPNDVDERAVTLAAYARGVLVEDGAWHWAEPDRAPPSVVIGYGGAAEPAIRRAIATLADAIGPSNRRSIGS
jgi:GntR family transcriptional regulator / MocR family aminotransferase